MRIRSKRSLAIYPLLFIAQACGGSSPEVSDADRGGPGPSARIEGLPAGAMPLASTSGRFQQLWEVVEEAIARPLPTPDTRSEAHYQEWLAGPYHTFIASRADAMARARELHRELRASIVEERAMAAALVSHLFEKTADEVLSAPVPDDPARPERRRELREALEATMAPLLEHARIFATRCVEALEGAPVHMSSWLSHCREARERLTPP